ncbi:phosphopyruvate hydratase [Candidatus Woesearchaeota archaeon]|nr:phosphopyruvate hydratase [Candidatus Woesearchaeota archaeon]MBW3017032.1 phosphopyruvate hydratase [Candidatus Woesearchaeota archaeon]
MKIKEVKARKVLDSRGNDTIEVEINGATGGAPAGASTGSAEATTFPHGVDDAVRFVNKVLAPQMKGKAFDGFASLHKFEALCQTYDKSEQWKKIGGSLVIATEYALLNAMAQHANRPLYKFLSKNTTLPRPMGNCVGGGAHAGDNSTDIQEFLLLSLQARRYSHALIDNAHIYHHMKKVLQEKDPHFTGGKTDEGAWAPNITNLEVLETLYKVVKSFSKKINFEISLGLDMASSEFFKSGKYSYRKFAPTTLKKSLSRQEQIDFVVDIIEKYNLKYVEDPLEENDFKGFAEINERTPNCLICGDDLTTTNPARLQKAIDMKSVSAIIVKPNQIGSLVKTKQVIDMCLDNNIVPVISHRSGETLDTTIAHLAVAWSCPIIKCGIVGGERIAKLNELLRIEEELK